jgi:outer membrane immunogenic protein
MNKTLIALLATVALSPLSPASAADIEAPAAYDWTGFYLGIHGGYGWGTSDTNDIFAYDLDPKGWFGGGQAGYNYQLPNKIVLGIEADVSFGNLKDDSQVLTDLIIGPDIPTDAEVRVKTFGTARLRAGYAFDRVMPYVTGGLGWARQEADYFQDYLPGVLTNELNDTKTYLGWTLGAGIEAALTDNLTAKIEYLYSDLGSKEYEGTLSIIGKYPVDIDLEIQTVRLGLNYKF